MNFPSAIPAYFRPKPFSSRVIVLSVLYSDCIFSVYNVYTVHSIRIAVYYFFRLYTEFSCNNSLFICKFPLDCDIVSSFIMASESEGCTMLTITEVSRSHGVSTRMLRYYEQQGLIVSQRREGYAYRVYDEENIARLRLILVLRKLRVPLKSIAAILTSGDAGEAIRVLRERIAEIDEERRALTTIREILAVFIDRIGLSGDVSQRLTLLGDDALLSAVNALGLSSTTLKEKTLMSELKTTDTARWKGLNVR